MVLITLNLVNLITAFLLGFLLVILPGYSWRKNFYFIFLLFLLGTDLVLIHLQMVEYISVQTYVPLGLSLIVCYGPSFYFQSRGNSSKSFLQFGVNLILVTLGLWVVFIIVWNLDGAPHWLPTAYFIPVLIVYYVLSINNNSNDSWTRITRYWFGGLIAFFAIESLWLIISPDMLSNNSGYMVLVFHILNMSFVMLGFWYLLRRPDRFSNIKFVKKYQHRDQKELSQLEMLTIEDFVIKNLNFIQSDLNRQKVTDATGIPPNRISEIVNGYYNKNFKEWINDLRVDKAKTLLQDNSLSIKEIYYDSGFASKSVFNNAFKLRVGKTPSEYRKELL